MIKMSDVFELPVEAWQVTDVDECVKDDSVSWFKSSDYAAHAINNFDGLVEALEELIDSSLQEGLELCGHKYTVCRAMATLTAAKGETK
jgi:hypothetical protein